MKIKYGSIVTDGSGKLGGHVYSKNTYGSYVRTKVTPTNPQTSYQTLVRNYFTTLAQGWKGLTEDQRSAWIAAVGDFKSTDVFGDSINPTGENLYISLNMNLLLISESIISTPPAVGAVHGFTSFSVAADNSDASLTLTFADVIPATDKIMVFATDGLSAGKSYAKNLLRKMDVLTTADLTGIDVGTEYVAKFGTFPAVGKKIFVMLRSVNLTTGQSNSGIMASCIVQA